ncbi:FAD-dependent oxidoreductase [Saccharicrinis sp. FJH62]|uniref:FAD-dependent oxidoreductase n=1 Tax=Saccharicrinis sp. FJH62 TaxID=3344657 RepID=UPI0035D4EFA8
MKLKLNHTEIEFEEGKTIYEVAKANGIDIPVMCFNDDLEHFTSCMICLVKDAKTGKLMPSCTMKAEKGMDIITNDEEVQESRKMALELLLSEHVGDCEAPCRTACPAYMDIPLMNRLLAAGKVKEAWKVVTKDIALPSVLGRICPAPCEGVCRRKPIDGAVSICLLKRYAGDVGSTQEKPDIKQSGKKVAIIGSGIAGLAAAKHSAEKGHAVTIFEKEEQPGGKLRYDTAEELLPKTVLNKEINQIKNLGVTIKTGSLVDEKTFKKIQKDFNAIVIASGGITEEQKNWEIPFNDKGFIADQNTYATEVLGVFVVGTAIKLGRLAIKMLAQGKEVAFSVDQYVNDKPVVGETKRFNSRFGKLKEIEFDEYLKESLPGNRIEPKSGKTEGFTLQEMKVEAARCLHCDCRKPDTCKLRLYSDEFDVKQKVDNDRRHVTKKNVQHDYVIFETGKCIKCGICVRMTAKYQEDFGFTFIGRGFDVEIGIPFNKMLHEGLKKVAVEVADACPTGAIARK